MGHIRRRARGGRHAIALELRGHGGSSHPGEYSVSLMADDLAAFLDHRGLARVDLVGHSLGGLVAWRCTLQWPDRVRRLVIEDAPPPPREVRVEDGWPEPPAEPPEPVDFDWEAGHHIHRERPLEFAQTVLPFLADG